MPARVVARTSPHGQVSFALEDAVGETGCFTPEANLADGRAAAYEALQSVRAIERELEHLVRA